MQDIFQLTLTLISDLDFFSSCNFSFDLLIQHPSRNECLTTILVCLMILRMVFSFLFYPQIVVSALSFVVPVDPCICEIQQTDTPCLHTPSSLAHQEQEPCLLSLLRLPSILIASTRSPASSPLLSSRDVRTSTCSLLIGGGVKSLTVLSPDHQSHYCRDK